MHSPLYLVDASIYVFRSYYSIPPNFYAADGELVNAVYGYTQFLLDLLEHFAGRPVLVSVAFDESLVSCYRNKIYPDYKANRELPDANLEYQLKQCQEITRLLGFHSLCLKDYEADDIIGTLLKKFGEGRPAVIVTRDKDLGQLVRPGHRLWDFAANTYLDEAGVIEKFGVRPDQIADFLALAGDTVDNIPGAPGVGAKTAVALLAHFGSLAALLDRLVEVASVQVRGAARLADVLTEHEDNLKVYREITAIHCEVPMAVKLKDLELTAASADELAAWCDVMAFGDRVRGRIEAAVRK
jgi:5'-3' exonuclease